MVYDFKDKVAIVTGGGSGLGAALAKELVARGARVVIADINVSGAKKTAESLGERAEVLYLDVTDASQVESIVTSVQKKYGCLDLMFNNAGISKYGEALYVDRFEWGRVLDINLGGVINGSLAAYAVMVKQRRGHIVNISSMAAFMRDPLLAPYVTSKSGVLAFSQVLALEAEDFGIGVCVVCPGNIRTPMLNDCEPSRFNPPISPEVAALRILTMVTRNERFAIFPLYARLIMWLDRLSPNLLNPLRREILRRARLRHREGA